MYVCYNCGLGIELKSLADEIFCPRCSCKILFKESPSTPKEVKCD